MPPPPRTRNGPERPEPLAVTSNDEVTQVLPAADLTGVTVADATTVTVGQTVTYRVAARDRGPNQATGVTLTDRLPDNLAFSAGPSHARLPQLCHRTVVRRRPGRGTTTTLTLRAKAIALGCARNTRNARNTVTVTVTVTGKEKDPDATNNTDGVAVWVQPAPSCDPCSTWQEPRAHASWAFGDRPRALTSSSGTARPGKETSGGEVPDAAVNRVVRPGAGAGIDRRLGTSRSGCPGSGIRALRHP
ncbi:hypothetical protein [Streptomyces sp. NPDC056669]|uniref:hypothetical protein n=1 Tax=Streptomyces sp. NPDC056669 TaxID=3345903 RepID=UPI00369670A5